jgi:hypothetical protein
VPNFCLFATNAISTERFWVRADNEQHARRLVALNVGGAAAEAEDASKFSCIEDTTKTPPPSFIYCSKQSAVSVERR